MISLLDKKRFLNWFVTHLSFSRREVSWLLNYLADHEAILTHIHFVENAEKTPRGISIQCRKYGDDPLALFLDGKKFTDTDQVFHEIRLNWEHPLYLECLFPNARNNDLYLRVLEANPYYRWNDTIDQEIVERFEHYFSLQDSQEKLKDLYQKIDQALEEEDQEQFLLLSKEVNYLLKESTPASF